MTDQVAETTITAPDANVNAPPGPDNSSSPPVRSDHLKRILSLKVPIIVKVTEKKLRMAHILKFNLGNVIHFDQDAYQHVELMVNNSVIGLGQPVKIGEKFGLKIVQIGDITDTIKALKTED